MMKRRLADASLPSRLSPHLFRVAVITDLLEQGVPLEDVQHLAGHADPRTTRLYDGRLGEGGDGPTQHLLAQLLLALDLRQENFFPVLRTVHIAGS
jgi:integrase